MYGQWRDAFFVCLIVGVFVFPGFANAAPSFQEAFEKHNSVMLLIDPKTGEIVDANPAAGLFYGYAPSRLRQMKIQHINQLTPAQVAEERKLAQTEGRNFFIFRHVIADGSIKTVEVHSVPLTFDDRVLLYSIIRDISKERGLQDDLWHYQKRLEKMVDLQTKEILTVSKQTILLLSLGAAGLVILVVVLVMALKRHKADKLKLRDNREHYRRMVNGLKQHFLYSHNTDGIFTYVSPSIALILGYTPEEFLTDFDRYLTDAPGNDDVAQHTAQSILGEQQPAYCLEIFHKDGSRRVLEVLESPVFDEQGQVEAVEGIAEDITERQQLVTATQTARDSAEHASQAKSEFLANMSHELRTPLNSIIGFAQLMEYEIKGPLPKTYQEYTGLITNSGRLLLETVNSILDLAKIEAGKFDLELEPVLIADIIDEVISLLNIQAQSKGIALRNETEDMGWMEVDATRAKQVFLNVIGNAIKFTDRGSITVSNRCDDLGHCITITDTGIGMTPEQIEIALKPFQQVHGTSLARRYQGTGLGLSLSRQIMELHGGDLRVFSTPDRGTEVMLRFPGDCKQRATPSKQKA